MHTTFGKRLIAFHPAYNQVQRLETIVFLSSLAIICLYLFNLWYADQDLFLSRQTLTNLLVYMLLINGLLSKTVWFFFLLCHRDESIVKWKFELSYMVFFPLGFLPAICLMTDYFINIKLYAAILLVSITLIPIIHSIHFLVLHPTGIYRDGFHHFWQEVQSCETNDTYHDHFRVYLKVHPPYQRKPSEITLKFKKEQKEDVEAMLAENVIS